MKRKNKKRPGAGGLEKKLAAYTLAGVAALLAPGQASAAVVYVSVDGAVVNQPGSYVLDVPGGQTSDEITIVAQPTFANFNEVYSERNGASILVNGSNETAALAFGALIDPAAGNWGNGGKMVAYSGENGTVNGEWSTSGEANYLGFYFGAVGSPQAGWVKIATSADATGTSFRVLSYAYETTPNVSITAGAGEFAAVPEPSTMGLLAIGGAGLLAFRRRHAANA